MRVPHVLVGDDGAVSPASLHHLRRVLRMRPGQQLSVTDGRGRIGSAVLTTDGVEVSAWSGTSPPPVVTLCVAVSKGAKVDLVVEKATELGVARIVPVVCERSERRPDASRLPARVERWRTIAAAALEQSRGAWLPEVAMPVPFDDAVGEVASASAVLLHPGAGGGAAEILSQAPTAVGVGPEGGFTEAEVAAAAAAGWHVMGLGPRVLRTETAAIVAVSLAVAAAGGLA